MRLHPEELAAAQACEHDNFEGLTVEQTRQIRERGRQLYKWMRAHPVAHNLVNLGVVVLLFAADWLALTQVPGWFGAPLWAAALAGALHGYLMYSLGVFSMHEGAAHGIVFLGNGRLAQAARRVAGELCRVAGTEPRQYAECHMAHHAKFGTHDDGEFTSFVAAGRFWRMLLPYGVFVNHSDFVVHRPLGLTRSRLVSGLVAVAYQAIYGAVMVASFGWTATLVALLLVGPHFGFYLDRLRQFTEHNLLPLENVDGSRNFGVGFWGLLVGGGPWGSPCHWSHHLVASLSWYHQIVLHFYIKSLLTPAQREQFLLAPVTGFPKLWWRLVREARLAEPAGFAQVSGDVRHGVDPVAVGGILEVSR